jgi:hypothetical protein
MRALTLLLLCAALCATGADGGNASAPRRWLTWGASLDDGEERLPGWQGEQSRGGGAPHRHETKGDQYAREDRERGTWMELIAWRPRAYVIHNFMAPEECVELVKIARPFMARSTVVDSVTGESKVDPIRTRCDAAQDALVEAGTAAPRVRRAPLHGTRRPGVLVALRAAREGRCGGAAGARQRRTLPLTAWPPQ